MAAFQAATATSRRGALAALQDAATSGGNVFEVLMEAVRHCSLGQITHALYAVGGEYRRNL